MGAGGSGVIGRRGLVTDFSEEVGNGNCSKF